jgi:small-conductance mechanosensitive channel
MKILIVVLVLAGSFLLIHITGNIIKLLIKRYHKWRFLGKILPLVELIVGLVVVFWTINFLFKNKSYYSILVISIIVVFIGFLSWFLIKDLIAGYVFRLQNNLRPGTEIQLGRSKGRLLSMHATHIIIETGDGKTVKIPYSRISNEIVSEQPEETIADDSVLTLRLNSCINIQETEEEIRKAILNSPWRLLYRDPVIKLKSQNENFSEFEIQVKTRNNKHLHYLYNSLVKKFEGKQR